MAKRAARTRTPTSHTRRPPQAWGYCRISLDRDNSVSIEAQRELIAQCNQAIGLPLTLLADRGVSGAIPLFRRPAGAELLQMQPGDHLIVAKADRAFRSFRDGVNTIADLADRGIYVHCLDAHIDTSTPIGRAMLHVMLVFAQLERERISERQREAAAYRRANGYVMHCRHNPPPGWRVEGRGKERRYVADPIDRRRCNRLLKLYRSGLGYWQLVHLAAERGWRTRHGTPWAKTSLRRALRAAAAGFPTTRDP